MKSLQFVRWLLCLLFAVLPLTGRAALQDSYGTWATFDDGVKVSVGPAGVTGTCDAGPYHMGCSVTGGSATATGFNFTLIVTVQPGMSFTVFASLAVQGDIASGQATTTWPDGFIFTDPIEMKRTGSPATSLSVTNTGTGYGNVASSPAGISCYTPVPGTAYLLPADCTESYTSGTKVTLTATLESGSTFAGWSGACTGTGPCAVTVDAAKSVTATFNIVPFVAAASVNVTATSATITSRITFNAPDVGRQGAVYVTAWVPVGALGALGISAARNSQVSATSTLGNPYPAGTANSLQVTRGRLAEMDASAFVLVQLTASGWQVVTNGQLVPYVSGVLGDQLAAQTILNNTDATNLNGAQFCLGYGTSAEDMIAAGRVQVIATIPDPNATSTATGTCLVSQIIRPTNYSDWWADPAYGGSSVNISQQGSSLGVAWYFYDATGTPTWIFGGGDLSGAAASLTLFSARGVTLGPPTAVSATPIGTATITFTSDSAATFAFTYTGTSAYPDRSGQLSLSRYTLTSLPIAGTYRYAARTVQSACTLDPSDNGTFTEFGTRVITVASGSITIRDTATNGSTCTWSGPYTQNGSKISVAATFTCSNGWSGNGQLDLGFTDDAFQQAGTGQVTVGNPCQLSTSASGVRQ